MNTDQFVEKVAARLGITKKDADKAVKGILAEITDALTKEEKLTFVGFGSFETRAKAARKGRNPQTGKEIMIAASKTPAFKAGKGLKDAVAGK